MNVFQQLLKVYDVASLRMESGYLFFSNSIHKVKLSTKLNVEHVNSSKHIVTPHLKQILESDTNIEPRVLHLITRLLTIDMPFSSIICNHWVSMLVKATVLILPTNQKIKLKYIVYNVKLD